MISPTTFLQNPSSWPIRRVTFLLRSSRSSFLTLVELLWTEEHNGFPPLGLLLSRQRKAKGTTTEQQPSPSSKSHRLISCIEVTQIIQHFWLRMIQQTLRLVNNPFSGYSKLCKSLPFKDNFPVWVKLKMKFGSKKATETINENWVIGFQNSQIFSKFFDFQTFLTFARAYSQKYFKLFLLRI